MARKFGKYRLERQIGRGAVGEVWLARDTAAERSVALKILTISAAEDPNYRRRFEREARVGAGLDNPHIVPIHGFGEQDGRLYLDMAYVPGIDLSARLRAGAIGVPEAVDIVSQIATALDAAHAAGLIHRDVKPANIIVHASGFAYLIDFGIARAPNQTTITATGFTVGTLAYMAPERFTGHADARSDIYSLACVLFECLTAQRPFGDTDPAQQLHAHLREEPPRPSAGNPAIPVALDAVIARGMAKEPADRYAHAGDLAAAARAAVGMPHPVPRTPPVLEPPAGENEQTRKLPGSTPWPPAASAGAAAPELAATPPQPDAPLEHPGLQAYPPAPPRPTRALPESAAAQANPPEQSTRALPGATAAQPDTPAQPPPTRTLPDDVAQAGAHPRPTRTLPENAAGQAVQSTQPPPSTRAFPDSAAAQSPRTTRAVPDTAASQPNTPGHPPHPTRFLPETGAAQSNTPPHPTRILPGAAPAQPPRPTLVATQLGGRATAGPPVRQQPPPRRRSIVKTATILVGVGVVGLAAIAACTAFLTEGGGSQPNQRSTVTATTNNAPNTRPQTTPSPQQQTGNNWPPPGWTAPFPTQTFQIPFPTQTFQIPFPTFEIPGFPPPGSNTPQ
ncbi:serine/threonine-protein kinase [Nocardia mexicana]|uniref:non-specific serine/threonine protein kinase n=1 Tax=Nocardia mexicana TaxID=279262 RepID=A0A370H5N8_9NOCA|nr:serine/threonine-protein kinase [Nocardia mexicana]RDI51524.1 serine/threonine-protein kinase [Nocardia mexicana]